MRRLTLVVTVSVLNLTIISDDPDTNNGDHEQISDTWASSASVNNLYRLMMGICTDL